MTGEWTADLAELGVDDTERAGGKGAQLGALVRAGLPVPAGFVVLTPAYASFLAATGVDALVRAGAAPDRIRAAVLAGTVPGPVADAVRDALAALGPGPVAVRSSATTEDRAGASSAGQQDTLLDVTGPDAVLDAVVRCWASLHTDRAVDYRARHGDGPATIAVVVQRMVHAEASGVLFTANPADGSRDEIVVAAAWGLGESVVGGTVDTDEVVVDARTSAVLRRTVADKAVMTVPRTGGGTAEVPVPEDRRRVAVLDDAAAAELAALGRRIEDLFGTPQDVEWVHTADGFAVVQARPVTTLPEPAAPAPTSWPVPYPGGWYFRASIVEQLPDPLTPLFADLVDGAVTRSLTRLLNDAIGPGTVRDGDLAFPTVNGYAYYFYRHAALLRMCLAVPSALRAFVGRPGAGAPPFGIAGWRDRALPGYLRTVDGWAARDAIGLAPSGRHAGVVALLDAGCTYYTAVQSIIPLAATAELAFRAFHDRLVRRAGDPAGQAFLVGFGSEPVRAEESLAGLATAAREAGLAPVFAATDAPALAARYQAGEPPDGADRDAWRRWADRFRAHLDRYGHTVYDLDFAVPVPADDPAPLLDAVRYHLSGAGTDPVTRRRTAVADRERATVRVRDRLGPLRRPVFDLLLRWAQRTGPIREDALAAMGLAWPLMRRMLRGIGAGLVERGVLDDRDDVFWLRDAELRALLDAPGPDPAPGADPGTEPEADLRARIARRRARWRGRRTATAPQVLPEHPGLLRVLGPFLPAADQAQSGSTITGVAAGTGRVTGTARVVDGPAGFGALRPGEVLVARITTPAWTPLFGRAAAVVTDVGGPLSHSSIVAREYGIPAVLGTGSATGRIRTGTRVTVDGDRGTVTLHDTGPGGTRDRRD